MVNTLPDHGSKLKEVNRIIDNLLMNGGTASSLDEITVGNTSSIDCPLTKKLEELSVLTPHQGARKRSVDLANQQAFTHYTSSRLLPSHKPKREEQGSCQSMFFSNFQHLRNRRSSQVSTFFI